MSQANIDHLIERNQTVGQFSDEKRNRFEFAFEQVRQEIKRESQIWQANFEFIRKRHTLVLELPGKQIDAAPLN